MRLERARVQNYRSVKDTEWFDLAEGKTILVGPNEAGKTAILRGLEHVSPGPLVEPFDELRDYPRSEYEAFRVSGKGAGSVRVASATFTLDADDKAAVEAVAPAFTDATYERWVTLANAHARRLDNVPERPSGTAAVKDEFRRLAVHADSRVPAPAEGADPVPKPSVALNDLLARLRANYYATQEEAAELLAWLDVAAPYVDETNNAEVERLASLRSSFSLVAEYTDALAVLDERRPVLVYFNTYTRVRPVLHLKHLADAEDAGAIDPSDPYNFGNYCLLKLLGYTARELSDLGNAAEPPSNDTEAFESYRKGLDERYARLNSASLRLTSEIRRIWQPEDEKDSDYTIRITADQQYLRVAVQDSLGVEVELDQRSEGFQWLVSFFIVFFAQAADQLKGAILLLDEPGLSLHGLKQRQFRETLSRLAEDNQLVFTTHSPFLVGPDELDVVRVVEMPDREAGTRIHNEVIADDPASLLPLQEALGYDLAQSLFAQQRNLILEGLTDYWYLEATASMIRADGGVDLKENIALVPASSAGKVVYFATILHAQSLKVAALLDSDAAGDQAAKQDTLLHTLGNRAILRTKDSYSGPVASPEVEDMLRETLVVVAKNDLGWDVMGTAGAQPSRPIVDIFADEITGFSKYKLAKAYLRWTRDHVASDLASDERTAFDDLIQRINKALK